jgi:flagellar L-ring protein precursor FlgH
MALAGLSAAPALAKRPPPGFAPTLPQPAPAPVPADGAIFHAASGYAALIQGARAHAVGDTLTIALSETTSTSKTANTKTQRSGSMGVTPPATGPFSFIKPTDLNASAQSSFNGQGNAVQTSTFSGTLTATIAELRANGTALVRGEKIMLLSQGQEWIQFSGIVRLTDLDTENTIPSAKVADARIEYSGNGAIQRAGREGWLSHLFNIVSPF